MTEPARAPPQLGMSIDVEDGPHGVEAEVLVSFALCLGVHFSTSPRGCLDDGQRDARFIGKFDVDARVPDMMLMRLEVGSLADLFLAHDRDP